MTASSELICQAAVEQMGVDAAAITVRVGVSVQDLVTATDGWAARLEELQYTAGEGPGVDAFACGTAVLIPDLRESARQWPGFVSSAALAGAGAMFAFPLGQDSAWLGTIDLYRHAPGGFTHQEMMLGSVLAGLATKSVLATGRYPGRGHYAEVSVAAGMVAAQLEVAVDEASIRLRAYAFREGRSVVDLARDVVTKRLCAEELDGGT